MDIDPVSKHATCICQKPSDNAHNKRWYVENDNLNTNVVIVNRKLIKLNFALCNFICIAYSPRNRLWKQSLKDLQADLTFVRSTVNSR